MKRHIVGKDPMPIVGTYIVILSGEYTDVYSSEIKTNFGKVTVGYPSEFETVEQAIAANTPVCTRLNGTWWDEDGVIHEIAYTLDSPQEHHLHDGLIWAYMHDYMDECIVGGFPFFDLEYMELAVKHGLVDIIHHSKVTMNYPTDGDFTRHTYTLDINGEVLKAGWNEFPGADPYFVGVYSVKQFNEAMDSTYAIKAW